MSRKTENKRGAALVESCLVLVMLCLILFGVLQVSYLVGARDVLSYASMASARSAQVGYNDLMVEKAALYLGIPAAGPIITPSFRHSTQTVHDDPLTVGERWGSASNLDGGGVNASQYYAEMNLKERFLAADSESEMVGILNYDNWMSSDTRLQVVSSDSSGMVSARIFQNVPMVMPFARIFAAFIPSSEEVNVYRGDTRGLARNSWGSDLTPGSFSVPALEIQHVQALEDHAAYYLGGN